MMYNPYPPTTSSSSSTASHYEDSWPLQPWEMNQMVIPHEHSILSALEMENNNYSLIPPPPPPPALQGGGIPSGTPSSSFHADRSRMVPEPFFHFVSPNKNKHDEDQMDHSKGIQITEKQKSRRRASQNLASRNYRQRKKEYMCSMEERLDKMQGENERLQRELNDASLIVNKLLVENKELKLALENHNSARASVSAAISEEQESDELVGSELDLQHIIERLDNAVLSDADEHDVENILMMFNETLTKRQVVISTQLKKLASPIMQSKIASLDASEEGDDNNDAPLAAATPNSKAHVTYASNTHANSFAIDDEPDWWEQFVQDSDMTDDQIHQLRQLRHQHIEAYRNLQEERRELNAEIRTFYHETSFSFSHQLNGNPNQSTDVPTVLDIASKIDALRQNVEAEKDLILETHGLVTKVLSPKQLALFITRTYLRHHAMSTDTLQMMTHTWVTINRGSKESMNSPSRGADSWGGLDDGGGF